MSACDRPMPRGWTAIDDLPPPDVPGDLRYFYIGRRNGRLRLMFHDASGSVEVGGLDEAFEYTNPQLSPDGRRLMVLAFDKHSSRVLVATLDGQSGFEQISTEGENWTCPSWSPDGTTVLVERKVGTGRWAQSEYDLSTGRVDDFPMDTDVFRNLACADEYGDRLLVTGTESGTSLIGIWLESRTSGERTRFAVIEGCNSVFPVTIPGTQTVGVTSNCSNVYDRGLWTVRGPGAEPEHVLNGLVAAPSWSPDGAWLLFGHERRYRDEPELWIASADGRFAVKVVDGWASWPAWIPAGVECAICGR